MSDEIEYYEPEEDDVVINLTEPQTDFFASDAPYVAAVAGFGSGKTQVAVAKIMNRKLEYPTIDQAYLAPSYSLIRDIFYPYMRVTLADLSLRFTINKSEHNIYIEGHGIVYCRTMNDPDLIVGWQCGDAVMDEFDVLPKEKALQVIRKVSARCRQKYPDGKKNQKYVTTTPEGFKATYELFKKNPLEGSHLVQMSTYSNEHNLSPGYIDDLKALYPSQLIEAYLNGEFVNLTTGTVYYAYDRKDNNTHVVARPREPLHIGMDFNVRFMAAIVHVIRDGKAYAVDELLNLRDTPDMIDAIQEKYSEHTINVYPDASGKGTSSKSATLSDITLLQDAGFLIRAKSKNPLIKDRVASTNAGFEKRRYFINKERCPQYAESREQQIYNDAGVPDKSSGLDHPNDAGDYFIFYLWPVQKSQLATQMVRGVINVKG